MEHSQEDLPVAPPTPLSISLTEVLGSMGGVYHTPV